MKKHTSNLLLILVFLTGLSLLLYPTVSDYWNSMHQSRAIAGYTEMTAKIENEEYDRLLNEARDYNQQLLQKYNHWILSEEEKEEYSKILDVSGTGIIGYIEIDKINCSLPVYHSTEEQVLQIAIGHIEGSSLPVGGESTHSVLSGHRGLPSAKLFSELDQLVTGDTFLIRVLDEVLTYEVDQIRIVEPEELESLEIEPGKDFCTLVTCTPYGINTHRLLVRGHRVETIDQMEVRVTADAIQIEPIMVAPVVAVPLLMLVLIWITAAGRRKKKEQTQRRNRK